MTRTEANDQARANFGSFIRELKSEGISLRDIESKTGINRGILSNYIHGKKKYVSLDFLTVISTAFNKKYNY